MSMAARMPQTRSLLPLARWFRAVARSVGDHWVPLLLIGVILLAALGSLGVGRKVESWSAASTIEIGTVPTIEGIRTASAASLEPVESASYLATRIGAPQFQFAARADARKALHDSRASFAGTSLRGVAIGPSLIRLEASAGSKEEAVTLLQKAILAIQAEHQQLLEPRMELLRSVRGNLQEGKALLREALKKSNAELPKALLDTTVASVAPLAASGNEIDRIVNFDIRITMLNYMERTVAQTSPQGGSAPAIEGPRDVNLVQRAILAGLGLLFFAVVFTFFFLRRPAQHG